MLDIEGPDWAGIRKAHDYIAAAIRNLVLFSDESNKDSVKSDLPALATEALALRQKFEKSSETRGRLGYNN
jgi:hypothetical protein